MTYDRTTTEAILFGDACYNVSGPMAEISRQWGMFQLSYGDTDPVLSDRDKYPNFFRVVPSDSDFNPARLALLRHFNWSIIGTLFQDASHGSARYGYAHNRFDSLIENSKINITKVESFSDDPSSAMQNLKDRGVRIIVGNFDENMARRVFCSARQKGMYGPRHQWIILGTYSRDWWRRHDNRVSCTPEELNETLHGYIATDILPLSSDEDLTESGMTPGEYNEMYETERGSEFSVYHGYAYDGIWVIARALERLLDDDDDIDMTGGYASLEQRLRGVRVGKALNDTNIRGVTGRVQFNNGDRLGSINILQMQGGTLVKVAEYNALTEQLDFGKGRKVIWWRDDKPPKDRTVQYEELRHVSTPVYLSLVVLASTGIIMACCFLGLNIHFRRHRFIKMSSPNMNNVIIVGCILCYFSIVLLGTDGSMASSSPDFFRYWCRARAWVLALGFTLAFGAMFSKTWRVHAIFTNLKLNRKVIKDYKLILVVMILVMLDVALLVAWQVVDPFTRAEKRLAPEIHEDYEVIPKLEFCSSRHMEIWMGSIYAYKGLLLAFGCFLAWETRQVSIPALNDSKYIGMSVYNVVIMCTCGAAVTFLIQDQPTHSFLIIAVFILFATTATLCLVFGPKIIQLRRDPKGDDKRIRATLRKPSSRSYDEDDHFQHKVRLAAEENRRLRGFLEQKAAELDQLLDQLGEEPCSQDISMKSVLHKKVLALRSTDQSPSKVSRASTHSDVDLMSTYSDVSSATTTLYVTDSPPGGRPLKARLLNNRMHAETIELIDFRGKMRRKSSVTIPPQAEEEDEDDDPFGGVYLGPPDPPPIKKKPDLFPPRRPVAPSSQASPDSGMANSCNNTSQHEPPTLGLTSSITQPDTGETQLVPDLLTTWREEEGEMHYSKTPSVLLLQAGQQSRLGVSSGRQSRVNRRASAPISIWTIAEVGEEDHAPRFGMDRNHALRSGKDVVPEADQPLAEVEDHDGETVEKAVKNCLEFLNEHMLESSVSDPEGYLGDTEDKICEERMTLHKQQNVEATSDDDLDEYSEYGAGIVEGESLSLSVDECMYISLDQGPSYKTMSSVVPEDQIGEASGTDTQSNVVVTVLLGVDELLISHKDQTTGESPCDMDGYLGDAEDTSCSAVPEESSAEGILGDSQGYLGDIDDTETQEIFSVSYEDRQSTEDSLGDSENCHSEKTDVKTPDVCSPQEEQADLRLTRDEQGTQMKNEETVMLGPEDTQRSDLQTDNPAGAEIPDNNIDTSQCRDLSTRHFANETPDQMCHEEKRLPLNVVVGITEELPFPGDFDEEHQDSMNTFKDDVQDEKNTNGANQTKNSNCALDDRSETKKDLTMISIFNVTQHCDLENRNQGLGEPPFDAKHADEEAMEVLRTCETFEGEPETDLVEQKTQDNVHHVQSETKPDELGETQRSVREAEQDIGVREQSDDVQSSECRAVKDSGEEAIRADTLHADSQTVNCSATHGTGDGGAQHDMCETAQDIVYEQPRGTQRSDSEASKNNSDGKTYDDALNLEIQTLMDLVESDPVGDKQHSECKEAVGMPKGPELSDGQAMARQSAFQNSADAQDGEYEITTPSLDVLVAFQNSDCGDSVSVMSHASCEKVEANEADVTQGNESCMAESLPSEHACLPEQNSEKNVETSIPVLGSQEEVAPCFNKDISAGEDYSPKRQAPDNFILEGPGQQRSYIQTFTSSSAISPAEHHRDMRQDITTHHQSSTDTSVSKNPLRENDRLIPNTNIPSPKIALDKRDDGNTEHLSECADLFGGPGDKHNDQSLDISGLPDNEFSVGDSICRFHDDSESTEASFAVCHTPSSTQSSASQPQCSSSVKTDDAICSATPESTIAEGFSAADESTADTSNSKGIESAIGSSNISIVEPAIDESISATVKLTADKFGSANDEPSVDKDCGASIEPGDHETCSAKPTADESSDETVEPSAAKSCGKTVQAIIDETLETLFQPAADERYGTTFEAIGSGSCDAAVEHNVEENCSDTAEPGIDTEYRRQNEATVRDDCKKHAVHVNEHVTVTAGSPAAHSNDEHVTVTAGSPAAHSDDEHVTVTAGSPAAHSDDEHVTVTAGSPAAHSNDEHLQKRTNSPSGFQDDDENKMDSDEHDGYCSDLAARSVHSESDPDDAVHPSNRSSCREPNNSPHSKEVLLSKSRVPADTSRGGEPDSPRALGKKLRKGSVGGGTAQVYPQVAADSAQQPLSAHGSEEELWACPASMTSSVPAASSPRVTFACDVIEEI